MDDTEYRQKVMAVAMRQAMQGKEARRRLSPPRVAVARRPIERDIIARILNALNPFGYEATREVER